MRTCGEPNEIDLTAAGVMSNGPWRTCSPSSTADAAPACDGHGPASTLVAVSENMNAATRTVPASMPSLAAAATAMASRFMAPNAVLVPAWQPGTEVTSEGWW